MDIFSDFLTPIAFDLYSLIIWIFLFLLSLGVKSIFLATILLKFLLELYFSSLILVTLLKL